MNQRVKSDFLFAQPSFLSGASRTLDLWGAFDDYNRSGMPVEADEKAIAADWLIVGQDLYDAIECEENELEAA